MQPAVRLRFLLLPHKPEFSNEAAGLTRHGIQWVIEAVDQLTGKNSLKDGSWQFFVQSIPKFNDLATLLVEALHHLHWTMVFSIASTTPGATCQLVGGAGTGSGKLTRTLQTKKLQSSYETFQDLSFEKLH